MDITTITTRLSDEEYEALSYEYEQNPPELSGAPGFLTDMREQLHPFQREES